MENRDKLYGRRWKKRARIFLLSNPLCRYCEDAGHVTAANVVDHITPHKGDERLFWDKTNWQPMCKPCHDGEKQKEEYHGYRDRIGLDGWPVDERHPINDKNKG